MTIASEITRIKTAIANAYTACQEMGATMPLVQDSDHLEACIDSISVGPVSQHWYNWSNYAGLEIKQTLNNIPFNKLIVCMNGIYLAWSWNDSTYYTSTDLENWTQRTFPDTFNHYVIVGNDLFCFCPYDNVTSNKCYFSSDGINWVEKTFSTSDERNFYFAGNKFFAEAYNISSSSEQSQLMYTDGLNNWNSCNITSSITVRSISYGNNIYVCAGQYVSYSSDGINWTATNQIPNSRQILGFLNNVFISNNIANKLIYSSDGINWTDTSISAVYNGSTARSLKQTNNTCMVYDSTFSAYWVTNDGINWTQVSNRPVTYPSVNNNVFFGGSGSTFYYSHNGVDWSSLSLEDYGITGVGSWSGISDDVFITSNPASKLLILGSPNVYTLDQNPTTSSVVYSAPSTQSALTITSVGTGTITLSDTYTYTYNSLGDIEQ